ncbi:hypothetical protein MFM001_37350 [Mycobacterium sp. MFM001]|nr:hypothetical protein MFM001_37350 [Mycobacterium sp. MFM001]
MVVLGSGAAGGGTVTVTVLVITGCTVDVTVATEWLDPPQPASTIAAVAIAVFFACIEEE